MFMWNHTKDEAVYVSGGQMMLASRTLEPNCFVPSDEEMKILIMCVRLTLLFGVAVFIVDMKMKISV